MYPKNIHMYIDEENYEVQMKRIQELKITENKQIINFHIRKRQSKITRN